MNYENLKKLSQTFGIDEHFVNEKLNTTISGILKEISDVEYNESKKDGSRSDLFSGSVLCVCSPMMGLTGKTVSLLSFLSIYKSETIGSYVKKILTIELSQFLNNSISGSIVSRGVITAAKSMGVNLNDVFIELSNIISTKILEFKDSSNAVYISKRGEDIIFLRCRYTGGNISAVGDKIDISNLLNK